MFLPHHGLGKTLLKRNQGGGVGSVLLDGGLGGQSSYSSVDDYLQTTNRKLLKKGMGLADVGDKLENLVVKPIHKKIRNIKFNM
jgi:hypothetical protein